LGTNWCKYIRGHLAFTTWERDVGERRGRDGYMNRIIGSLSVCDDWLLMLPLLITSKYLMFIIRIIIVYTTTME
jgi:hypothetical protein